MWLRLGIIWSVCEGDGFEFVGAVGLACEVDFGFCGVGFFSCGEVGVFGVVEHQVFHFQYFCLLSGIERCAMVLFVGAELFAVAIEAECFAQKPVASHHVWLIALIERFIAQAHHALAIGHQQSEAILHGFGRTQVEARHFHIVHHQRFAIVHFLQDDAISYGTLYFLRDEESANGVERMPHFAIAIDGEMPRVLPFVNKRRNFANEPHHAQNVVGVHMRHKDVTNFFVSDMRLMELTENTVTPTGVDEHPAAGGANIKASIIAAGTHSIAGAQKSYSIHIDNFSR